jgi:hypothetical protein
MNVGKSPLRKVRSHFFKLKATPIVRCAAGHSHFLLDNGPNDKHLVKICPHHPESLSGTFVQNMDHPAITKI